MQVAQGEMCRATGVGVRSEEIRAGTTTYLSASASTDRNLASCAVDDASSIRQWYGDCKLHGVMIRNKIPIKPAANEGASTVRVIQCPSCTQFWLSHARPGDQLICRSCRHVFIAKNAAPVAFSRRRREAATPEVVTRQSRNIHWASSDEDTGDDPRLASE